RPVQLNRQNASSTRFIGHLRFLEVRLARVPASASNSGEPFVAEVLPVSAGADRLVNDLVDPLDHLVAELDRRIETERRALLARHPGAVAAPGEDGLRVL